MGSNLDSLPNEALFEEAKDTMVGPFEDGVGLLLNDEIDQLAAGVVSE